MLTVSNIASKLYIFLAQSENAAQEFKMSMTYMRRRGQYLSQHCNIHFPLWLLLKIKTKQKTSFG